MPSIKSIFPFLSWLPLLKSSWKGDLIAGLTGTIIVIPQAVALAMIAGLPPIYGFYTAMITPIIAALFGSSYHLVTGPTTTGSIVIYSVISQFVTPESDMEAFIALTILLTFMTGVIKFVMGLARMGKLVNFVSYSVVIGFSAGAGILIAFKQLKHVFGINVPQGSSFYEILSYLVTHINETNLYVLGVAVGTLLIAMIIKKIKYISKLNMLLAIILGSVLAAALGGDLRGIETIGNVPSNLPPFKMPNFNFEDIRMLTSGAMVLAIIGLVEAISISRVISLKSYQKLNNNREFIGQGLANIVSSFFSSYISSGSFSRSALNEQTGAKTPFAAIISAIGLLLVVLFFASYASYLAKPTMGGIIVLVGYNLIDFQKIKLIVKSSKRELIVLMVTLLGTLFLDLETALFLGIIISLFFYLEKTSKPNIAVLGKNQSDKFINIIRDDSVEQCPQLKIIRIDGAIYFGAVEGISNYFFNLYEQENEKHLLIVAKGINFIDLAGAEWLQQEVLKWQNRGGGIYFVGLKIISQDVLRNGGFIQKIGMHNFFKDKLSALTAIYKKLDEQKCLDCEVNLFYECKGFSKQTTIKS